jgi:hypothetical protein
VSLSLNPRFPREKARQGFDNVGFIGNENEPRLIEKLDYSTAIAVGPGPRADAAVGPQIGPAHGGAQNPDG